MRITSRAKVIRPRGPCLDRANFHSAVVSILRTSLRSLYHQEADLCQRCKEKRTRMLEEVINSVDLLQEIQGKYEREIEVKIGEDSLIDRDILNRA